MLHSKFMLRFASHFSKSNLHKRPTQMMSSLKQKLKAIKIKRPAPKSQIVSLLSTQLDQLSKLSHYQTSTQYLEKNNLSKSYDHLKFALTESKSKYPQSINLQMFILNRICMLNQLRGDQAKFVDTLQQIFFMCLSLKGDKSLQTLKHLQNYLIALLVYHPFKLKSVVEFLNQSNFKLLLKKSQYLIGISEYINGDKQKGLHLIKQSPETTSHQKYIKSNNLNWLKILDISNQSLQFVKQQNKDSLKQIVKDLIKAFIEAEKVGELTSQTIQMQKNLVLTSILENYYEKDVEEVLKSIKPNTLLLNSHSHIIAMNIAHTFYLMRKFDLAVIFMKLGLQTSIQLQQPQRLGLGLILLGKIDHKLKMFWEPVILDILKNGEMYSTAVLKQCLNTYSRFLFIEGRFYQAEAYANQAQKLQANLYVQGLVLPDYDFSF